MFLLPARDLTTLLILLVEMRHDSNHHSASNDEQNGRDTRAADEEGRQPRQEARRLLVRQQLDIEYQSCMSYTLVTRISECSRSLVLATRSRARTRDVGRGACRAVRHVRRDAQLSLLTDGPNRQSPYGG